MAIFSTSVSAIGAAHGVFAIDVAPPASVPVQGTGVVAIVDQFPWGPVGSVYTPTDAKDAALTFAPPGMSRTGSGYLAMIRKSFPILKVVRVLGPTAVTATSLLLNSTPATAVTVAVKYPGVSGNSITCVVSAASDGDATHWNLTVSVTGTSGTSGTTTDTLTNLTTDLALLATPIDYTKLRLVSAVTKVLASRPVNGTYACSGGTDGTITAAEYVGTLGSADKGLALLESDGTVRHVTFGDPGNTLRPAANAGMVAHVGSLLDRVGYINGNSGITDSAARTDAALYQSTNICYVNCWANITDDVTGATQLVPGAPFAASVASQLSPSTSIAWKDQEVRAMLKGIVTLEREAGANAALNTQAGVCTLKTGVGGAFVFEAGVNTAAPVTPAKADLTRTNMGIYIAVGGTAALQSFVDAPNVTVNQDNADVPIVAMLDTLKRNASRDPNHTPHIVDYALIPREVSNTASDIANGNYTIASSVQTSKGMERIIQAFSYGPTVTVVHQ